jgi:hypothetical protein
MGNISDRRPTLRFFKVDSGSVAAADEDAHPFPRRRHVAPMQKTGQRGCPAWLSHDP